MKKKGITRKIGNPLILNLSIKSILTKCHNRIKLMDQNRQRISISSAYGDWHTTIVSSTLVFFKMWLFPDR